MLGGVNPNCREGIRTVSYGAQQQKAETTPWIDNIRVGVACANWLSTCRVCEEVA